MLTTTPPSKSMEIDSGKAVLRALADVISIVEPRLVELWQTTGVTFGQRRLLARLRRGSRTAGTLAAELGIAGPSLTRQLQKLEEARLLSRAIDTSDRRRVIVKLTPAGERLLIDHRVLGGSRLAGAVREMSEKQRRDLLSGLRQLLEGAHD